MFVTIVYHLWRPATSESTYLFDRTMISEHKLVDELTRTKQLNLLVVFIEIQQHIYNIFKKYINKLTINRWQR